MVRLSQITHMTGAYNPPMSLEDAANLGAFYIVDAREVGTSFGDRIVFTIMPEADEEVTYDLFVSPLPQRVELLRYFLSDEVPEVVGPVVLEKVGRTYVFKDADDVEAES